MFGEDQDRTVVVEGASDRVAVETLAARLGRDLAAEGVRIVELGGATNIARFLEEYVGSHTDLRLAGLYDAPEERFFLRAFQRVGIPAEDRGDLARLGFFACEPDLEDELIRALGERRVLEVIDREGELASFGVLQHQPAQRERSLHDQVRRFLAGRSGHKLTYARAFVEALDLAAVPVPLELLLRRC